MSTVVAFLRDEQAATAIEYALIAVMVGIVAIGALQAFGTAVSQKYDLIATSVGNAGSGS